MLFVGVILAYAGWRWLPLRIVRPRRTLINLDPGDLGYGFEETHIRAGNGLLLSSFYVPATVPPLATCSSCTAKTAPRRPTSNTCRSYSPTATTYCSTTQGPTGVAEGN